jgi:hypothetical protein
MSARAAYVDPNIASLKNLRSGLRIPSRARSFPHDLSIKSSKRSSLSESAALTPQSFDEQDAPHQNVGDFESAGSTMTPTTSAAPFSGLMGNPNLPDMKPVMFPSENPFAYPNQPMSMLEAQQIMSGEPTRSYSSPISSSMYNLGGSNAQTPTTLSFDSNPMPEFAGSFNVAPPLVHQGRQIGTPLSGGPSFDTTPHMDEPADLDAISFPSGEGYWSQMDRSGVGRTGLTPGGINLDELFGAEGWSNIWNAQSFGR